MTTPKITVYLDVHDVSFAKCEVTYVPILLGGLMNLCNNTAPITITNKKDWINQNRRLWARTFNIPMKNDFPPNFPPRTLSVMRHLVAIQELDGSNQARLLEAFDAIYDGLWQRHEETYSPDMFMPILRRILGETGAAKIANMAGKEAKKALLRNTEDAFNDGAFGLPWMVCTNSQGQKQSFWGVDHVCQVANFLGIPQPASPGWRAAL
ncbi:2-hydroxychromene-2-carboxylate isomerase, putative [Cordyceps militaris CM01]|uniref:Glutathione S-transferase kappa n=2 Tax=Cordyceps militaris TaxID=73501 RepID=G3JPU7_CORMM|nr:2-hydroxychromene-2-carboxylate isomerase, putative [Cordyceps militaris CM01]ATY67274.1 HCCA isomerase glutathione S-transferase kappa [Cordyceps militaris]EGX89198.1 2-hydroxychromene-2-carboxylate isomerase, putative [Cordyceps militaris CM01]